MNSVSKVRLEAKANEVHTLDAATQDLLASVKSKNNKALKWFIISWTVLFLLAVFGIFKQNQIASQNKTHIDCIVKLLATPQKPGTTHKFITDAQQNCNIKFTQ